MQFVLLTRAVLIQSLFEFPVSTRQLDWVMSCTSIPKTLQDNLHIGSWKTQTERNIVWQATLTLYIYNIHTEKCVLQLLLSPIPGLLSIQALLRF